MKSFLSLLLVAAIILGALVVPYAVISDAVAADTPDPVRVYMIYDPETDVWFGTNFLNLSTWGEQTDGEVWTSKRTAQNNLNEMYGSRAARCVVKAFVLLPVGDKE